MPSEKNNLYARRDSIIQKFFEAADDSLQGIIGYHMYVDAMQMAIDPEKLSQNLPERSYSITFNWVRLYRIQNLVDAFREPTPKILELWQGKLLLVSVTSIFDAALSDFANYLIEKNFLKALPKNNYKERIIWAYETSVKTKIGSKEAIDRLPRTIGMIDNARRLRNCIVHNNGLFNEQYEKGAIQKKGIMISFHPHYNLYRENPKRAVPIILDWHYLHDLIKAHIEVLHILHNEIQRRYFGILQGYSYMRENKPIDWRKILWGKANVRLIMKPLPEDSAFEKSSDYDYRRGS